MTPGAVPVVVADANVLYSAALRDLVIELSVSDAMGFARLAIGQSSPQALPPMTRPVMRSATPTANTNSPATADAITSAAQICTVCP